MKYELLALSGSKPAQLKKEDYSKYKQAIIDIHSSRDIEFTLDTLVENYHDFIDELLLLSTWQKFNINSFLGTDSDFFLSVNRKVNNCFSSLYQYHEHLATILKKKLIDDHTYKQYCIFIDEEKNTNKGFEVAFVLRDLAQHCIQPVDSILLRSNLIQQGVGNRKVFISLLIPYFKISNIRDYRKRDLHLFQQFYADEKKDSVDLRLIIAESVHGTLAVHKKLVIELESRINQSRETIEKLFNETTGKTIEAAYLQAIDENRGIHERLFISKDIISQHLNLKTKHLAIGNINKWGFGYQISEEDTTHRRMLP